MTTVKLKEVSAITGDGLFTTNDTRYNTKRGLLRIIIYCIMHGFSFRVGFRDSTLIKNKNYIEIVDDWFLHFGDDRSERYDEGKELKEWLDK